MDNNIIYWIWLQQILGYGNNKIKNLLSIHKNAKLFYELGYNGWKSSGFLTEKGLARAKQYSLDAVKIITDKCVKLGQSVIAFDDIKYPERLRNIDNPPCVLYVKGDLPDIENSVAISIVGTRSAINESMKNSFDFAYELNKAGVLIISGGAVGIDESAHKGALASGGKTVCVLGNGIDVNYPRENTSLRYNISRNGALVSEYPPGTSPVPRNFPVRNRIISGLSLGTLVVQASRRSGALITANLAIEQNRDVFSIPGNIRSKLYEGTNNLIKNGAKPVTCPMDIIEEYINVYTDKFNIIEQDANNKIHSRDKNEVYEDNTLKYGSNEIKAIKMLSDNAKKVYNVLDQNKKHIDNVMIQTKLPTNIVLQAITELEIHDLIESYSGKRYSKKLK